MNDRPEVIEKLARDLQLKTMMLNLARARVEELETEVDTLRADRSRIQQILNLSATSPREIWPIAGPDWASKA